jgi:hypothetical protein
MPLACRQFVALLVINSFLVPSAALADPSVQGPAGGLAKSGSDVAGHLNSSAMIFGRCVWIRPRQSSRRAQSLLRSRQKNYPKQLNNPGKLET